MRMAALDMERQTIVGLGHNGPPEPTVLERAEEAMLALSNFLNETPVIETGEHLVRAKQLVEHARGAMAELEAERTALVDPLNKQLAGINSKYKSVHNTDSKKPGTFDRVFAELKARLTTYAVNEEKARAFKAECARVFAEKAEQEARAAEAIELQAKQDAVVGVIDTGVAEAIKTADEKFADYEVASRFAARAERDVTFRIGNGHGKALGMRTEKTLVLESYGRAIKAIGPNEKIETAILSAARDYRKEHGALPDGVSETSERKF